MLSLLRHPFALLLAGALFSAVIVPRLTRQWQNEQKELEVRTGLVSEMSETVMRFVTILEHVHVQRHLVASRDPDRVAAASDAMDKLVHAFQSFDVSRSVVGTKLEAYLPDGTARGWTTFSERLIDLYRLERVPDADYPGAVLDLADRLKDLPDYDERRLDADERARQRDAYVDVEWGTLELLLLAEKLRLIRVVLRQSMPPFAKHLIPRLSGPRDELL
jgi:hypothetical protein